MLDAGFMADPLYLGGAFEVVKDHKKEHHKDKKEKREKSGDDQKEDKKEERREERKEEKKEEERLKNELLDILEKNTTQFLLIDLSPAHFYSLLDEKMKDGTTVGTFIASKITIEDVVKLSFAACGGRLQARLSILCQNMIRDKNTHEQVVNLDLAYLSRFVELLIFTGSNSFVVDVSNEDEVNSALADDPNRAEQIESFEMDFRQAQLLTALMAMIFTSHEHFFDFLQYIRELIHKSFQKLTDVVSSDSLFPIILDGFMSPHKLTHTFFFRLMRTVVLTQDSRTTRVLSGHELLKFISKGLLSEHDYIRRNTMSLWQLILHSDSSLVLLMQIVQASPSAIIQQYNEAPEQFEKLILSIFKLFKNTKTQLDYRPMPFSQFQSFFKIAVDSMSSSEKAPKSIKLLHQLISLCLQPEAIYCFDKQQLKDLLREFATTQIPIMANKMMTTLEKLKKPEDIKENEAMDMINKFRFFPVLTRLKLLDPTSLQNKELWQFIFKEMGMKQSTTADLEFFHGPMRTIAWKVFRNAVLFQAGFIRWIKEEKLEENAEPLKKTLGAAFGSFDEKVIACMVDTLPILARPLETSIEGDKENLTEIFSILSDDSVLIAGRILAAYKGSKDTSGMSALYSKIVDFLTILLKNRNSTITFKKYIPEKSDRADSEIVRVMTFKNFMDAPSIRDTLKPIFDEVSRNNNIT